VIYALCRVSSTICLLVCLVATRVPDISVAPRLSPFGQMFRVKTNPSDRHSPPTRARARAAILESSAENHSCNSSRFKILFIFAIASMKMSFIPRASPRARREIIRHSGESQTGLMGTRSERNTRDWSRFNRKREGERDKDILADTKGEFAKGKSGLPHGIPSFPVYTVACKRYSTNESEIPRLPDAALTFHVRRYVYRKSI